MATEGSGAPRTLVVTNDFPPRLGGVQQYVWNLVSNLPPDRIAVLAPRWPGWREHDDAAAFRVERWSGTAMWPTDQLARRVRALAEEHGAEVVLFGHGYPLPLLGPSLARSGLPYVVLTHGAEVWMARLPGMAGSLRRGLADARAVTVIADYTAARLRGSVPPGARLVKLTPAVDESRFSPTVDGSWVRERHGLDGRPLVLCVSRLVPRKGQDVLIRGVRDVLRRVPEAVLVIAGDGPDRPRLEVLARGAPAGSVVFAGAVADADLPALYAACDVFAMPCRSRWLGLEVEGFGIVYLEAAAAGKVSVAGRSGGAGEAVEDAVTGLVTEGREPKAVALAVGALLADEGRRRRMGSAGRARVEAAYTWRRQAARLADLLSEAAAPR